MPKIAVRRPKPKPARVPPPTALPDLPTILELAAPPELDPLAAEPVEPLDLLRKTELGPAQLRAEAAVAALWPAALAAEPKPHTDLQLALARAEHATEFLRTCPTSLRVLGEGA